MLYTSMNDRICAHDSTSTVCSMYSTVEYHCCTSAVPVDNCRYLQLQEQVPKGSDEQLDSDSNSNSTRRPEAKKRKKRKSEVEKASRFTKHEALHASQSYSTAGDSGNSCAALFVLSKAQDSLPRPHVRTHAGQLEVQASDLELDVGMERTAPHPTERTPSGSLDRFDSTRCSLFPVLYCRWRKGPLDRITRALGTPHPKYKLSAARSASSGRLRRWLCTCCCTCTVPYIPVLFRDVCFAPVSFPSSKGRGERGTDAFGRRGA